MAGTTVVPAGRSWGARAEVLAVAGLTLLAACLLAVAYTSGRPYSSDSASYVEAARHFAAGRSLVIHPIFAAMDPSAARSTVPLTVWPPLYPLMVGGLIWAGLAPMWAALVIPAAAMLLLPGVLWMACRRIVPPAPALVACAMTLLLPAFVGMGARMGSDALFLLFSVAAVWVFLAARQTPADGRSLWALAASGAMAGLAFATRYPGLALMGALGLVLAVDLLRGPERWPAWRAALWWGGGILVTTGPVLFRNWRVAGALTPTEGFWPAGWSLPRFGLLANVHAFGSGLAAPYLGFWVERRALLGAAVWAVFLLLVLAGLVRLRPRAAAPREASADARLLLAGALFLNLALLVAAGVRMGAVAEPRYFDPVIWIVNLGLVGLFWSPWDGKPAAARPAWRGRGVLAVALLVGFVLFQGRQWALLAASPRAAWAAQDRATFFDSGLVTWLRQRTGPQDVLISNAGPRLRLFAERDVRWLRWAERGAVWAEEDLRQFARLASARYLILVREPMLLENQFGAWARGVFLGTIPTAFPEERRTSTYVIVRLTDAEAADQLRISNGEFRLSNNEPGPAGKGGAGDRDR